MKNCGYVLNLSNCESEAWKEATLLGFNGIGLVTLGVLESELL